MIQPQTYLNGALIFAALMLFAGWTFSFFIFFFFILKK